MTVVTMAVMQQHRQPWLWRATEARVVTAMMLGDLVAVATVMVATVMVAVVVDYSLEGGPGCGHEWASPPLTRVSGGSSRGPGTR